MEEQSGFRIWEMLLCASQNDLKATTSSVKYLDIFLITSERFINLYATILSIKYKHKNKAWPFRAYFSGNTDPTRFLLWFNKGFRHEGVHAFVYRKPHVKA